MVRGVVKIKPSSLFVPTYRLASIMDLRTAMVLYRLIQTNAGTA